MFQINAVLLNFIFIKVSWKKCITVYKNIKQHSCFNFDINKKYFWAPNQHIRMINILGSCDIEV